MEADHELNEALLEDSPKRPVQGRTWMKPAVTAVIISLLSLISLLHLANLLLPASCKIPTSPTAHCGTSREEAKSLGCHFDPMSFSWLPTDCYDAELTETFLDLQAWEWYTDATGSPAPRDAVLTGEYDELFVSWEYHLLHCTYAWRKMHRALLHGRPVDGYIAQYTHTAHCEEMLLAQRIERNSTNTIIRTKFVSC
ncbi:uncharacterized protein N7459_009151 [Penicillium hispanicum]|uniref:uncharacterized protein n=1 Tax=Penicillium hispanicum TaxID=1080232 RepID=UPI00253F9620|nr:uncharacterized protein N7459_009151 [Penicillium hispanicum]KAJ5569721.1 hypothetical protein N7459_009151 [Penicillium hispanicum]